MVDSAGGRNGRSEFGNASRNDEVEDRNGDEFVQDAWRSSIEECDDDGGSQCRPDTANDEAYTRKGQ